jgi:hypothetical protein
VIDYGVTKLAPPKLSFADPLLFHVAVYTAKVKNFGTVRDGPALLSLEVDNVNSSCPPAFVLPGSPYPVRLKPGRSVTLPFFVVFFRCKNPSPALDYLVTAQVTAPGDINPDNDTRTATVDVRKRFPWFWFWFW